MHEGEDRVTVDLARRLVDAQFPQWRELPLEEVDNWGTVNAIFRLGEGLSVRFPLVPSPPGPGRAELEVAAEASRELARHVSVDVPRPVAIGEPGEGYGGCWMVQTWIDGAVVDGSLADGSAELAEDLARFIKELRRAPLRGRTHGGEGRGGDLWSRDGWVQECLARSAGMLDTRRLGGWWARYRELAREAHDVMSHGDLLPANLLVTQGRLCGVLDVGGFGPADPALDLMGAWSIFGSSVREGFRSHIGCDQLTWLRARAWAFEQALGLVWYYAISNPPMCEQGRRTLERIVDESE